MRIGHDGARSVTALTPEECMRYVSTAPYGRIIYTSGALPAVAPVTFVLDGDVLLFDVDPSSSLAPACHDSVLAFQADAADVMRGEAWSVTMTGRARYIVAPGNAAGAGTNTDRAVSGCDLVRACLTPELVKGHRTRIRHVCTRCG